MTSEIERYASEPLDERWKYALAAASAGNMLPKGMTTNGLPDAGKIFWTFETGVMLGIHPVAAVLGVNVIEGKPTLSPQLMSAVIRDAGHLIRVQVTGQIADLSLTATATLVRRDDPEYPFVSVWTIEKAQRAGLLQVVGGKISAKVGRNQESGVWEKYTEAMLKARAISEVCREGGTDALMGMAYTPEEMGADVNEAGELIAAPAEPQHRPAPQASDYRPIALADVPAEPAAPAAGETDEGIVELYHLADLKTTDDARVVWDLAQQNGHMDRPVEGKPLQQWLIDFANEINEIQANVNAQSGEVYEVAETVTA